MEITLSTGQTAFALDDVRAVLEAAQSYGLTIHRVSQGSGMMLLTDAELREMARLGAQQAIVATAHKIARAYYHILKHRTPFHDMGGEEYERRARQRELKNLQKRAAKLGFSLAEMPQVAALAGSF